MSDTPRTDAAVKELLQTSQHERVSAEFARELEREIVTLHEGLAMHAQILDKLLPADSEERIAIAVTKYVLNRG